MTVSAAALLHWATTTGSQTVSLGRQDLPSSSWRLGVWAAVSPRRVCPGAPLCCADVVPPGSPRGRPCVCVCVLGPSPHGDTVLVEQGPPWRPRYAFVPAAKTHLHTQPRPEVLGGTAPTYAF